MGMQQRIKQVYSIAKSNGNLLELESKVHRIEEKGMEFIVRLSTGFQKKIDNNFAKTLENPFLPVNEHLKITEIDSQKGHTVVLNKFCVVPYHFLLVTNDYESQNSLLDLSDFDAIEKCFKNSNGEKLVAFYNCGPDSGASQPHKHIQFIPYKDLPVESQISKSTIPNFTFTHEFQKVTDFDSESLHQTFSKMVNTLSIPTSFNFLMTPEWMLLVPRKTSNTNSIFMNSVGFLGWILVKTEEQLDIVKKVGPLTLLHELTFKK